MVLISTKDQAGRLAAGAAFLGRARLTLGVTQTSLPGLGIWAMSQRVPDHETQVPFP